MAVACGAVFSVTITEQGDMWTFGRGIHGVLGLGIEIEQ